MGASGLRDGQKWLILSLKSAAIRGTLEKMIARSALSGGRCDADLYENDRKRPG
jgi:hypothetical protein